jgi:hypothetical protein
MTQPDYSSLPPPPPPPPPPPNPAWQTGRRHAGDGKPPTLTPRVRGVLLGIGGVLLAAVALGGALEILASALLAPDFETPGFERYATPHPGEQWDSMVAVGLPCVVALILGLAWNRGGRRSIAACVFALVFGLVAITIGSVWLASEPQVECKTNVVWGSFWNSGSYDVEPCPGSIEEAYKEQMGPAVERAAVVVITIGSATALTAVWLLAAPTLTGWRKPPTRQSPSQSP